MRQFNIAIYLTIFLLSIIGCGRGCERLSKTTLSHATKGNEKPLIVLLHGLGSNASCFDYLKSKLTEYFPDADVVASNAVEDDATSYTSIQEQANQTCTKLIETIPDLQNRPTLLIGHSQGGLRAYKMYDLYKDELNIKGIITLATPWEGAPIIREAERLAPQFFISPVLDDMRMLSIGLGEAIDWAEAFFKSLLKKFKDGASLSLPGFHALIPNSNFLCWVKNTLPSVELPILAIGGCQNDFRALLTKKSRHDFTALNELWTKLIVGEEDPNQNHDMVVPLSSQQALNIIPEEKENFERVTIPDALHDTLLDKSPNARFKNIRVHPKMIKAVIRFMSRVLYETKTNRPHKVAGAA